MNSLCPHRVRDDRFNICSPVVAVGITVGSSLFRSSVSNWKELSIVHDDSYDQANRAEFTVAQTAMAHECGFATPMKSTTSMI
jgi:hypothetical protein